MLIGWRSCGVGGHVRELLYEMNGINSVVFKVSVHLTCSTGPLERELSPGIRSTKALQSFVVGRLRDIFDPFNSSPGHTKLL